LLGLAANGPHHVLTLSASVLAIIASCSPTEACAHIPSQRKDDRRYDLWIGAGASSRLPERRSEERQGSVDCHGVRRLLRHCGLADGNNFPTGGRAIGKEVVVADSW
jgi:hypothetical protein